MSQPIFSLVHTTARTPRGWRDAAKAWMQSADSTSKIEYVLSADFGETLDGIFCPVQTVWNRGPKTAVAGWNVAAEHATGRVLITVADDWFPCLHWDTELLKVIPDLDSECVVDVNTGGNPNLLTFCILTRPYFERIGSRLFHPEYIGMYADNEFTDVAKRDGVVVNARHLFFQHFHPCHGTAKPDGIYARQNRPEAYQVGQAVYERRKAEGFPA